ncbi:retrovirus-related pol polyprotein from transposon TNT 1-94 [Tanacetum coccineum]
MCVVNILNSVNATPTVKIVLNKGKQIWTPKGKLSDNSLNKTKQVWKATGKLFANVGYQWRSTGKKVALGKLNCGYQWKLTGKKFALGELCPLTKLYVQCRTGHPLVSGLRLFKTYDGESFKAQELYGKRIHMRDLTHLFSVRKICDSDALNVAFKSILCFVRDIRPVNLEKARRYIRTDNGTEFVNQVMSKYYEGVGIFHQKSVPRTPQQNGVVERRNCTLVEAARTMLIFSKAPMFLWAEAVATALFGALCYPTNDSEDLGKFQAKADIGIFIGYAPSRKGYRIYNKRTRRLMETIHVTFDEMHQTMAPVRINSEPVPTATVVNALIVSTNTSVSTTIAQDAPSTSHSLSSSQVHPPVFPQGVTARPTIKDTSITQADLHPSVNPVAGEPGSAQST